MRFYKFVVTALILGLWAMHLNAAEPWSADQKEAYKTLLDPSTIEKIFASNEAKKYWIKYFNDPTHVHITRRSFVAYEAENAAAAHYRWISVYKSKEDPSNKPDVWRIEAFGEYLPTTPARILFVDTNSHQLLSAWAPLSQ